LLEMNARESLILIPPQEEDHTHQPIKWPVFKCDSLSIGQLQDHACNVMCAQPRMNQPLPNSSAPSAMLTYTYCCGLVFTRQKFLNQSSWYHGKETVSRHVSAVQLIIIIFWFIAGIYKLFFLENTMFYTRKNIIQFMGNVLKTTASSLNLKQIKEDNTKILTKSRLTEFHQCEYWFK
jgi:hypothetical protein